MKRIIIPGIFLLLYQTVFAISGQINVETLLLQPINIEKTSTYVGFLTPLEKVTLRNEVAGIIDNINIEEGASVTKATPLLSISKDRLSIQYQQAKANLELAEFNYSREKSLFQKKISQEAKLQVSRNSYLNQLYRYKLAQLDLEKSNVKAPFNGQVSEVFVEESEYLGKGKPLLSIIDIKKLLAKIQITEHDLKYIKKGDQVKVHFDAWPEENLSGVVKKIAIEANNGSKGYTVEVVVNNPEKKLFPGMTARIEMVTFAMKNQLVIPRQAILERENGKFVYIHKGTKSVIKKIITGIPLDNRIQITKGLKKGDQLIVRGHQFLSDQSDIKITRKHQNFEDIMY